MIKNSLDIFHNIYFRQAQIKSLLTAIISVLTVINSDSENPFSMAPSDVRYTSCINQCTKRQ